MASSTLGAAGFALAAPDRERLLGRLSEAVRRARRVRERQALAGVTVALARDVDPTAVVVASRRPGEPWFCLEQPDRDRAALATLGRVAALEASGPDRFAAVARAWRALAAGALCAAPAGPRPTGPLSLSGLRP